MPTLKELTQRLNALPEQIPTMLMSIVEEFEKTIIEANINLLDAGKNYSGKTLTNLYTGNDTYGPSWSIHRQSKGLQVAHYDLNYTGAFRASLQVHFFGSNTTKINIVVAPSESQGKKFEDLQRMFGDIVGIPDATQDKLEKYIEAKLIERINYKLFN
jgi:hypothetical protein